MSIPTYQQAMIPVLRALVDGAAHHRRSVADAVADHFRLTPEERIQLVPSGRTPVIRSRTGWALTYLKQAGIVETTRRGWYRITNRGREVLASGVGAIDNEYLLQFPEFEEFRARSRAGRDDESADAESDDDDGGASVHEVPPDEALTAAYEKLRSAVEEELLETLKGVSPTFFEQLVVDLLVKMGYGGSRVDAARAIGGSGDGGVDGVIHEDRLGLDVIYLQAKRWDSPISRPEVQKFAGALQGQRAKKGVFITTSSFTRDAEAYARNIDARLVLIDGKRLAALMFDFDLGVSPRGAYVVKALDGDYFEDA